LNGKNQITPSILGGDHDQWSNSLRGFNTKRLQLKTEPLFGQIREAKNDKLPQSQRYAADEITNRFDADQRIENRDRKKG
jgi:hypothetical protein